MPGHAIRRCRCRRHCKWRDATPLKKARQWQAAFTPTVLFFDARGNEIAQRLVGVAMPDFYGAYLDAELATARGKLTPKRVI